MKAMPTKEVCLSLARRLYVDGDRATKLAKELGWSARRVVEQARTAMPELISEQRWTIVDVASKFGGVFIPLEMRKEAANIRKVHGLARAVKMTGVNIGSLGRWSIGKLGKRGVLKMGKLPWARLEKPDAKAASPTPAAKTRRKNGPHTAIADKRAAVYDLLTGTHVDVICAKRNVAFSAVYKWRMNAVGKSNSSRYSVRVQRFIDTVAEELGVDAKPWTQGRAIKDSEDEVVSRLHSTAFREGVVHRLVNQGVKIAELVKEVGVSKPSIYAWRAGLLGKVSDPEFGIKARKLAKKFMTEARVDDQLNGHPTPESPIVRASAMTTEVDDGGLESLSDKLAELDQMSAAIAKDRQIVTLSIENQQLRRQLDGR